MGYLSCRADSSISTCRSISSVSAQQPSSNHRHRRKKSDGDPAGAPVSDEADDATNHHPIRHFTYGELETATGNFSADALLGRGSHGAVYKAVVRGFGGRPVAVKRPSRRPSQSRDEVENEIDILSRVRGPRVVNIVGFTPPPSSSAAASGRRERLLVVEFMPNGTLYDLLHTNRRPPGWSRRLRLALQTARALLALHSLHPPVIHRDVKSANVLIDYRFNARIGDFGLALSEDDGGSAATPARSTPPAGTLGYLDPSYVTPENLSTKTDVFSFGILLLEIMSGRKAIDVAHSPPSVVDWAVPLLKGGKVSTLFDPRIPTPRDPAARRQLASLAASCVRSCKEKRPSMEEVVEQLKVLSKTVPARVWNGLSVVNPCSVDPCSVIDIEKTLTRPNFAALNLDTSSSPRHLAAEEMSTNTLDDEVPIGTKKLSPSVAKMIHPARNAVKKGSSNLKDLMARLDEDPIGVLGIGVQRSSIMRAKTLRLARDYYERDGMSIRLQRNQTVKGDTFETSSRQNVLEVSDVKLHNQAGDAL